MKFILDKCMIRNSLNFSNTIVDFKVSYKQAKKEYLKEIVNSLTEVLSQYATDIKKSIETIAKILQCHYKMNSTLSGYPQFLYFCISPPRLNEPTTIFTSWGCSQLFSGLATNSHKKDMAEIGKVQRRRKTCQSY